MDAVIVGDVPGFREWMEYRRERRQDRHDEVWDGVLHVVPSPWTAHQFMVRDLENVFLRVAPRLGLNALHELSVFLESSPGVENYRTPDVLVVAEDHLSKRGVEERAELVVEVLSPNDESRKKFGFYASCGIPEYWLVDPHARAFEIYVLRDGEYQRQPEGPDGTVQAPRLGLALRLVDGPKLRVAWDGGSAEI